MTTRFARDRSGRRLRYWHQTTCRSGRSLSVVGGGPDIADATADFRFWTQLGHWAAERFPVFGALFPLATW
jgi:hypothetical protein